MGRSRKVTGPFLDNMGIDMLQGDGVQKFSCHYEADLDRGGIARLISTTIRLDEEDVRALKRARAAGHSASDLVRKGLRVVASRYYAGRRPPSTGLFESTDTKLGEESELFRNLEN